MKKQHFYLLSLSLAFAGLLGRANAQCDWIPLGPTDTNQVAFGEASYNSIAVDPTTNEVYVAYRDGGNYYSASVKKYVNGEWIEVGTAGLGFGEDYQESITIDKNGTPYLACQDKNLSSTCVVYKYSGGKWDTLAGQKMGLTHVGQYISLTTDTNGVPYVAYEDVQQLDKLDVMMYNGTAWVPVGGSLGISAGQAQYVSLAISKVNNMPYVAYEDGYKPHQDKLMVLTYNGTKWVTVGGAADTAGISTDTVNFISLAIDKGGNPYVSYEDFSKQQGLSVMMFNGTSWSAAGNASATTGGPVNYTSIGVDASDNVYVAYQDLSNFGYGGLSMVMYNGSKWSYVGGSYKISQSISAGNSLYVGLALDTAGVPVVGYEDKGVGNHGEVFEYNNTNTQWDILGSIGLSNGSGKGWNGLSSYNSIAISSNGTPYTAYRDGNNAGKATVMSYNGTSWDTVGKPGISTAGIRFTDLGFDKAGDPICMFSDKGASASYGIVVMKYSGGSWSPIGNNSATVSGANTYDVSMAIANDTVYAAYSQANYHTGVMKCAVSGGSWANVGSNGTDISGDSASYQSIAVDKNGVVYVAFEDNSANMLGVTVMKCAGNGAWQFVGKRNFSAGQGVHTSIQIDPVDNMPVVAYSSWASSNEANVQKFDGDSTWNYIGGPGFSSDWTGFMSLAISHTGVYYVAYQDYGIQYQGMGQYNCTVEELDPLVDTAWVVLPLGLGSASGGGSTYNTITLDPTSGQVYVAFSAYSAYVKKLDCPEGINEVHTNGVRANVYPDPNNGSFTIDMQNTSANSKVVIYNILGENVYQSGLNPGKTQIKLAEAPGIYLYRILSENGTVISTGKLSIQ